MHHASSWVRRSILKPASSVILSKHTFFVFLLIMDVLNLSILVGPNKVKHNWANQVDLNQLNSVDPTKLIYFELAKLKTFL